MPTPVEINEAQTRIFAAHRLLSKSHDPAWPVEMTGPIVVRILHKAIDWLEGRGDQ